MLYTHVGLEDASKELGKMLTLEDTRKEMGISDKEDKPLNQNIFKNVGIYKFIFSVRLRGVSNE